MPDFLLRKDSGELEVVSGDQPLLVSPAYGPGTYDVYRLDHSASVTLEGAVITSAPTLSDLSATVDGATATLSYATDVGSGGVYWVMTTSPDVPPSWRIKRAEDHLGNPAIADGYQRVTDAGGQPHAVVNGLTNGTYHFHMYHRANNETSTIASTSVTLEAQIPADVTAPVLSNVTASISGNTASLQWSSDEAGGHGYWVCTTSPTLPSETQIMSGQDHTGTAAPHGTHAVINAGAQADQTVSGLSPGVTYFFHLIQEDANENISARYSTSGVIVANSDASAQIAIFNRSGLEIVPEAISMEIEVAGFDTSGPANGAVYNPQLHELYYFWDFDEDYTFTAPENLADGHTGSGVGYGPKVTHTYRTPGTYNVSCLVVEPLSGKSTTANMQITVGNSDSAFPGIRTVFVSPSSNFADAPAGARLAVDINQAFDMFAGNDQVPTRVMLNRGETYPFGGRNFGMNDGTSLPSTHIVAGPGSAVNPVIDMTGSFDWNDKSTSGSGMDKDFVWQNIDFKGPWDSVTETGSNVTGFNHFDRSPRIHLFDGCSFDGLDIAIYAASNDPNITHRFIALNDCSVTNWRSYGILYAVGVGLSLVGTKVACHPQASAGGPQDGQHNNQGPLRFHRGEHLIISNCDFFNRIGWSSVGPYQSIQPCLRQNVAGDPGFFSTIQASSLEAGAGILEYTVEEGLTSGPINALVEKCYLLGNHQTWGGVRSQMGGVTIRNNVIVFPGAARDATILNPAGFIEMMYLAGGIPETYSAPIKFYNNTLVNLMQDSDYYNYPSALNEAVIASQFSDVFVGNNIIHQPNLSVPVNGDGPLETSPVLWEARDLGYRTSTTPMISSAATPTDTVANYAPLVGSQALGAAVSGDVAHDDFYGNIRPPHPSRGAHEIS